jgi:hypothetical protein
MEPRPASYARKQGTACACMPYPAWKHGQDRLRDIEPRLMNLVCYNW